MQQLSQAIAENLKRLRAEQGLSLDALAKASGVSKSRLGQIERGEANPSISTIWQIANALKVEFSAIVTSQRPDSEVVRREDIEPLPEDEGRCRNYTLFPFDPSLGFEVYTLEIEPGGHLDAEAHPEGTREVVTVVAGELFVQAGDEMHILHEGDAIRFRADVAHAYRNPGRELAVLSLLVAYPRG